MQVVKYHRLLYLKLLNIIKYALSIFYFYHFYIFILNLLFLQYDVSLELYIIICELLLNGK